MRNSTLSPAPKSSIVESEELLGEELFLYDESSGAIHTLSSGAAIIWLLCDGVRDLETIAAEIESVCDTPKTQILPQVRETVTRLQNLGLIEQ